MRGARHTCALVIAHRLPRRRCAGWPFAGDQAFMLNVRRVSRALSQALTGHGYVQSIVGNRGADLCAAHAGALFAAAELVGTHALHPQLTQDLVRGREQSDRPTSPCSFNRAHGCAPLIRERERGHARASVVMPVTPSESLGQQGVAMGLVVAQRRLASY